MLSSFLDTDKFAHAIFRECGDGGTTGVSLTELCNEIESAFFEVRERKRTLRLIASNISPIVFHLVISYKYICVTNAICTWAVNSEFRILIYILKRLNSHGA